MIRAFLVGLVAVTTVIGQDDAAKLPNIVLVMVDDLGYADLGCYGSESVSTPHLDRLAKEGLRFTQAYSGCTVCAPARSTLMTGHHMGRTSVRLNTGGVPLRDEDVTIPEVLRDADYVCGGFGKWGLGDVGTDGVPELQGFDEFFGYYHQIHAHFFYPDYLIHNSVKIPLPGNAGFYDRRPPAGAFAAVDPRTRRTRQFAQDIIFRRTLDFIRANRNHRFFCYVPWTPPHGRYEVPADDPAWVLYKDRPWPAKARVAAAMITMIDRQVGALVALLDELGLGENTLVMFCSDHGAAQRFDGTLDSCGPFRGRKRSMLEGGLRVPLIARWPGRIAAGATTDHVCYFPDFLPTLAELTGTRAPSTIDGRSFLPTLTGEGAQKEHDYLYWEWERYDWGKRRLAKNGRTQALRRGSMKLIRNGTEGKPQLFDLSRDPGETNDLARSQPETVRDLLALMERAREPMRPQQEPEMPKGRNFR